jgi:hypothetical protein
MHSLAKRSLRGTFVTAVGLTVLLPSVAQASIGTASGASLQSASESAASHERSVHVVATTTGNQVSAGSNALATITIITDAARTEGIQHLTFEQGVPLATRLSKLLTATGTSRVTPSLFRASMASQRRRRLVTPGCGSRSPSRMRHFQR